MAELRHLAPVRYKHQAHGHCYTLDRLQQERVDLAQSILILIYQDTPGTAPSVQAALEALEGVRKSLRE